MVKFPASFTVVLIVVPKLRVHRFHSRVEVSCCKRFSFSAVFAPSAVDSPASLFLLYLLCACTVRTSIFLSLHSPGMSCTSGSDGPQYQTDPPATPALSAAAATRLPSPSFHCAYRPSPSFFRYLTTTTTCLLKRSEQPPSPLTDQ